MSPASALAARVPLLSKATAWPRNVQLGVVATAIALLALVFLWARSPDYRTLFSNLSDRDGGAIVTALTQMNVPYQLSDSGNAILVPSRQVHEVRLRLAEQGLPQHGDTGFELLDKTRFGVSQFTEQVNYQRALEGELRLSVEALHAVQSARVHLALPRESLFIRERQAPTASVLVSLYPGRSLSEGQITAITWLVSASVPQLTADKVSVVDQNGRLLTGPDTPEGSLMNRNQLIADVEQRTTQRILAVLAPLVGSGNVRVQVSADMDFSQREQTSETYTPTQSPGRAAVRSQQVRGTQAEALTGPSGVPGALSNEVPAPPQAPIEGAPEAGDGGAAPGAPAAPPTTALATTGAPGSENYRDATINYEVDRNIRHVKEAVGRVQRLSAAIAVNTRDKDGTPEPLSADELAGLEALARQAMGFDAQRGDTLSLVNQPFTQPAPTATPVWQNPVYLDLGLQAIRYLVFALLALLLWRNLLQPILRHQVQALNTRLARQRPRPVEDPAVAARRRATELNRHEENLRAAQTMATEDPRAVALVVRSWMGKDERR